MVIAYQWPWYTDFYSVYQLQAKLGGVLCSSINLKLNSNIFKTWNYSNPSNGSKVMIYQYLAIFGMFEFEPKILQKRL